jgi:hypothetical protein
MSDTHSFEGSVDVPETEVRCSYEIAHGSDISGRARVSSSANVSRIMKWTWKQFLKIRAWLRFVFLKLSNVKVDG